MSFPTSGQAIPAALSGNNISLDNLRLSYVNNGNNPSSMKVYVDKKLPKIKDALTISSKRINDSVTKIKIQEVINQINKISSSKTVKDNHVLSLMRVYELIKEVKDAKKL